MRFFLFERCILGIETAIVSLEPNAIVNDFAISRVPFDEIDSNFFFLKVWKITPRPIGPDRAKISEGGAE